MEKMRVDGANGVSFSSRRIKGGFVPSDNLTNSAINSASDSFLQLFKSGINPNKAVFTIDSKTSQILIVNHNACQLLGYSSKELCSMEFSSLLTNKNKNHVSALAEGQLNSEDGTMILLSGKVVEVNTKMSSKIAVSLWIRQIDSDGRCLAVAEPVERKVAELIINQNGYISSSDIETLTLFQFETEEQINGMHISVLIPAIKLPEYDCKILPKNIKKQKATGKTQDGVTFPCCLIINQQNTTGNDISNLILTIWVFTNLSGLIVIDENGIIESCNHHFSMLMFGYSENKMLGQLITKIIPHFGQEHEYLGYRSRHATVSSIDNDDGSLTETDPVYFIKNENTENTNSSNDLLIKKSLDFSTSTSIITTTSTSVQNNDDKLIKSLDTISLDNQIESIIHDDTENLKMENSFENNQNLVNCQQNLNNINSEQIITANKMLTDIELLTPVNEAFIPNYSNTKTTITTSTSTITTQPNTPLDVRIKTTTITPNLDFSFSELSNSKLIEMGKNKKKQQDQTDKILTSTPKSIKKPIDFDIIETGKDNMDGNYRGEAIHFDGNIIDIIYTVSNQILPCGRNVYCVWISRDPDSKQDDFNDDLNLQNLTLTFNSMTSTIENSLGQAIKYTAAQNSNSRPNSFSLLSQCEEEQNSGEYGEKYTTLKQIGKGAYGFVKMAFRKLDQLLVIVKFVLKEKLSSTFMVLTEENREMPMEIYLLTTISHPNIVSVLDVFENETFVQLVMEKHGSGMDLFEFIDRRPLMNEILACFIFRQIANAVDYLHSKNILHRDIKDENIIIDHNFHVKLIDFGSATFMQEGKLFSTFFGTTEYCSPEVLAGNKYAGPELEMWSLGVTLYVIIFFEHPFLDIEETLNVELTMPYNVSIELEKLLKSMLNKNPLDRCTLKQLIENNWLTQEIDEKQFNFNSIVRCEPYEMNPDIYYNDQKYSSITDALSTQSPHDTLSLVDDESIIDNEDDDDETSMLLKDDDCFLQDDPPDTNNETKCVILPTDSCVQLVDMYLSVNNKVS